MRIISGQCKGMTLKANVDIRPTLDRVKVTLFNMIQFALENAEVLDLFSGNGSLGIEALSRYANHCTFVENSRQNFAILKENLEKTKLLSKATLFLEDVFKFEMKQKYHFIFMDPPFKYHSSEPRMISLLEKAVEHLHPGGILVLEHPKTIDISVSIPKRVKVFHNTAITLAYQPETEALSEKTTLPQED
ncbi:MAG: 16S rRNA (guanine(966)-N(2))-methyltransferase RsmD [Planctomycetota bacterium]|mgnify:CR=1 FL=1